MHFMPDTEDEDSAAESFWPEGYKRMIREDIHQALGAQLNAGKSLRHIYKQYSEKYPDIDQFVNKIADMIVIGVDNGADDAFDDIISSFLTESPLPEERRYARYFWSEAIPRKKKEKLGQVIIDEYSQDNIYKHAYKVGYQGSYPTFDEFIKKVARLVVTGAVNGADDMLEAIYTSFLTAGHLPPARRHPRRLKTW